jgi:uncharacterized protein (TIGR04255 family)
MTFPASERVLYARNPIEEVICQVRFPPILRIDSEVAVFQEAIRAEYPLYGEEPVAIPGIQIPAEFAEMMRAGRPGPKPAQRFLSADQRWTVSLTRDFVALSTGRYEQWEEFRGRFAQVLGIIEQIFRPAFYTRIGLRYRDVFRRSVHGLDNVPWSELLEPYVAAELATDIAAKVRESSHVALIDLERGSVRVRHGLTKPEGAEEQSYTVDADFFTAERTELPDAYDRLDYFNQQAARLFRWCIRERLHEAMGPSPRSQ